ERMSILVEPANCEQIRQHDELEIVLCHLTHPRIILRIERCTNSAGRNGAKTDVDTQSACVDVVLGHRRAVTPDKKGLGRHLTLKGSLPKLVQEIADALAYLRPEPFVVWLKDCPLGAAIDTLFNEQGQPTYWDVLPFRGHPVVALQGACSPNGGTSARKTTN